MNKPRVRDMIRPGHRIEVGATIRGRPAYRWVQGWEVRDPVTGRYSTPMRYRDALAMARDAIEGAQAAPC